MGTTAYLENGKTTENAQVIAAHESPRTTKLYDRTADKITLGEVERIRIWRDKSQIAVLTLSTVHRRHVHPHWDHLNQQWSSGQAKRR